jgi:hypothetical protein
MTSLTRRTVLSVSAAMLALPVAARAAPKHVTLFKNPQCDCCEGYAKYLRQNGFTVETTPTNDLASMSRRAGVPEGLDGCHISLIEGYVVEGHVPVAAIHKLLAEQPPFMAITLPGMPEGSPGMGGKKRATFTVYAVTADGEASIYLTE